MKKILLLATFAIISSKIFASCSPGFSEVIVQIIPDSFPNEISWNITNSQNQIIASGGSIGDTICVDSTECHTFHIVDNYGDGIQSPGGYWLYVNSALLASGNNYGYGEVKTFNCPVGSLCSNPAPLTYGTHIAGFDDTWYEYTPTATGTYLFNTCGLNTCNTKIWVYTICPAFPYAEGVQGTYAYNDDNACGTQAVLNVMLSANFHYLIRIGDNQDSCTSPVVFEFSYVGLVQGCTDSLACNFNPMAVVDDGSCLYPPSPACSGPDLQVDSNIFISSLSIMSHVADNCDVAEGCVMDYGTRHVITFTTRINNIGSQDFYIGSPSGQPGMFNMNNCHGHPHYEGYGDYRLFDINGNVVPAGHKNGFCVIDLCGFGQYTCGNMGITALCYDAYGAGTQCQWLDITDVPTGDYRVVVIINSKHLPDALGRFETNYTNNALQVCMHITHNPTGAPTYSLLPNCTPYIDCTGLPGGTAEVDCNGICNGPGIFGDVFQNAKLDSQDVYTYLDILQSNIPANHCNDLSGDSLLTVYDAALVNWCKRQSPLHPAGSTHNHCNFPRNILNPNDSVGLAIKSVNWINNYLDVEILNPLSKVKAYQFTISGVTISSVVSLASPVDFPIDVRYISSKNEVIAISLEDSSLNRSSLPQNLVRIYFSAITNSQVCISKITDVINQNAERTITNIYGSCFQSPTAGIQNIGKESGLVIIPNPAIDRAFMHINGYTENSQIIIMDVQGKTYSIPKTFVKDYWYEMNLEEIPAGVYFVILRNKDLMETARFIKM